MLCSSDKARSVIKCAFHQQLAAPRSASTVDVSLQTAASVREAGEAATVPAVWINLFLTDISSPSLVCFPSPSLSLLYSLQVNTHTNFITGNDNWPLVKRLIFPCNTASHASLSSGSNKGALRAKQWVIAVSLGTETSLVYQRDTKLHLHLSRTYYYKLRLTQSLNSFCGIKLVKGIKQSSLIKIQTNEPEISVDVLTVAILSKKTVKTKIKASHFTCHDKTKVSRNDYVIIIHGTSSEQCV